MMVLYCTSPVIHFSHDALQIYLLGGISEIELDVLTGEIRQGLWRG